MGAIVGLVVVASGSAAEMDGKEAFVLRFGVTGAVDSDNLHHSAKV